VATQDERLIPVIIGVGQINDRPSEGEVGLNTPELMIAALRQAEVDAGVKILSDVQSLECVAHISFDKIQDTPHRIVEAIAAEPRFVGQTAKASGDSPVRLLNDAANRIGRGQVEIAAIVGGEAMRTYADYARNLAAAAPSPAEVKDERLERVRQSLSPLRLKYGFIIPTEH
jgi:acetyl-CoA C-acetyltransferase